MAEPTEGPRITIEGSCLACKHCVSESYHAQGDSGCNVSCGLVKRAIGDTTWRTPVWCPFLADAITRCVEAPRG